MRGHVFTPIQFPYSRQMDWSAHLRRPALTAGVGRRGEPSSQDTEPLAGIRQGAVLNPVLDNRVQRLAAVDWWGLAVISSWIADLDYLANLSSPRDTEGRWRAGFEWLLITCGRCEPTLPPIRSTLRQTPPCNAPSRIEFDNPSMPAAQSPCRCYCHCRDTTLSKMRIACPNAGISPEWARRNSIPSSEALFTL